MHWVICRAALSRNEHERERERVRASGVIERRLAPPISTETPPRLGGGAGARGRQRRDSADEGRGGGRCAGRRAAAVQTFWRWR